MADGVAGVLGTAQTRCETDYFHISNPSGFAPPSVCGTLTGEHSEYMKLGQNLAMTSINWRVSWEFGPQV